MTRDIERVKAMIRQMLAVAKNDASTEGEIENALAMAHEMMNGYHLSEEDLGVEPDEQWKQLEAKDCAKRRCWLTSRMYYWEGQLAMFCCNFVGGVKCYRDMQVLVKRNGRIVAKDEKGNPVKGVGMVFYGIADDVGLAADLFEEMRMTIITMAKLTHGGCYKGDGGKYSEGFVAGLKTQLEKVEYSEAQKAAEGGSTALVLIERRQDLINRKAALAKQFIAGEGVKLQRGPSHAGASGSWDAYQEGKADGAKADLSAGRGSHKPKLN